MAKKQAAERRKKPKADLYKLANQLTDAMDMSNLLAKDIKRTKIQLFTEMQEQNVLIINLPSGRVISLDTETKLRVHK